MCRFAARVVAQLDRRSRLAFLPLDDEEAAPLLAGLSPEERQAAWRLARPDGHLLSRGEAAAAVFELLGARPLAAAARRAGPTLDRAYGLVARRRRLLGRLVPDKPGPRRYP